MIPTLVTLMMAFATATSLWLGHPPWVIAVCGFVTGAWFSIWLYDPILKKVTRDRDQAIEIAKSFAAMNERWREMYYELKNGGDSGEEEE